MHRYGTSEHALLFKIRCSSFMNRGADVSFLSAFPNEKEYLYPPLTYLKPTGRKEVVKFAKPMNMEFTVIEAEAQL